MTEKRFSHWSSWFHGVEMAIFLSFMWAYFEMNKNSSEQTEESIWRSLRIAFDYWIDWLTIYHILYMLGFSIAMGGLVHLIKYFWKQVFGPFK